MKARALLVAIGIGLLLAGGVRAAEDPPKTAAETFTKSVELLKAGDVGAAGKYSYSPPGRPGPELDRLAAMLKSGEVELALADSKEDGDLAVIVTKGVAKVPEGETRVDWRRGPMIRKDSIWQIYNRIGDMKLEGVA